jgi:hypothetical protein
MSRADDLLKRQQALEGARSNLTSHMREVAQLVLPSHNVFFEDGRATAKGEKRNQLVFDPTASLALMKFKSAINGMMTPATQKWSHLRPSDQNLLKNRDVQLWFDEANQTLFSKRYEAKAGFQQASDMTYSSLGAFGTGLTYVDEDPERLGSLRYSHTFIGDTYIDANFQGVIDTVFRKLYLSNRQASQRWGDNAPDRIKKELNDKPDGEHLYVHFVGPNKDFEEGSLDRAKQRFISIYILEEDQEEVEVDGSDEFPFAAARYDIAPYEIYGRSPAMQALPAIKTINEMARTDLYASHMAIQPPILAYDDGTIGTIDMRPGHITFGGVNQQGQQLIRPFNSGVRPDISDAKMGIQASYINDAFLVTLFQILAESPTMTATEVMARMQEKGMLVAPILGRLQGEYLGTQIEREIGILTRSGVMPPMPEALIEAQGEYEIIYDSPISRLQRSEELVGANRTFEAAMALANAGDTSGLDRLDGDQYMQLTREITGAPAKLLRSDEEVEQIQRQRALQAEQQRQSELANQNSQTLANTAQAIQGT